MPKRITLDILIKEEGGYYQAHCLQFDLVTTDDSLEGVKEAIIDLCREHILFALKNDNMKYLFSPAPREIWDEYYRCVQNPQYDSREDIIEFLGEGGPTNTIPSFMINQLFTHV